jgi:hypothetical protein
MKRTEETMGIQAKSRRVNWALFFPCLVALSAIAALLAPTPAIAAGVPVRIVPASRVENIESPPTGLPDQQFQNVTFESPLITSLLTAVNRGGTGNRSFLVTVFVSGGGFFSFQVKENQNDITLPLTQPIPITGVSIRCDSFSDVVCQYTVSLVGSPGELSRD